MSSQSACELTTSITAAFFFLLYSNSAFMQELHLYIQKCILFSFISEKIVNPVAECSCRN